jgi:hypothetical protein
MFEWFFGPIEYPQTNLDKEINRLAEKFDVKVSHHVTWTELGDVAVKMLLELEKKIDEI